MRRNFKGYFLVLTGSGLWGLSGIAAQMLFSQWRVSPQWLVSVRMLVSGCVLLMYASFGQRSILSIWRRKNDGISLLLFSIFGMLGVQLTYFMTINESNAATATILQYLAPVFILAFSAMKLRRIPEFTKLIVIFVALLGTMLLVTNGKWQEMVISERALLWGGASALTAAFYTAQPQRLLKKFGVTIVVGWSMVVGGVVMSVYRAPWASGITDWSWPLLVSLLFVVIFGTIVAFLAFIASLKYISAFEASILASAEPLTAIIATFLWLKTPFGGYQLLGAILIIAIVFIIAIESKNKNIIKRGKS